MDKLEAQRIHAIRRAKERYGTSLTGRDLRAICDKINTSQSVFLTHCSGRVSKHKVEYKGTIYLVVYDKSRKSIATFLPPNDGDAPVLFYTRGEI